MFFIFAVILIAIGGILFMLFFDEKPKSVQHQKIDSRAISIDQSTLHNDEVTIVFDEPKEVKPIEIKFDSPIFSNNKSSEKIVEKKDTISSDHNEALTTNSKINPFNF